VLVGGTFVVKGTEFVEGVFAGTAVIGDKGLVCTAAN
jgi:hypothetical protein